MGRYHPKDRRYGGDKFGGRGGGVPDGVFPLKPTEWVDAGGRPVVYRRFPTGGYRLIGPDGLAYGPRYKWEGSLLKDLGQQADVYGWTRVRS